MGAPKVACRPREHVVAAGQLYGQAWRQIDHIREGRGIDVPDWPQWCYVPIAGTQAVVAEDGGVNVSRLHQVYPERLADAARLAGLAAWRMTQGIYRFDPAVYGAVANTPVTGELPHELLYRLPEWCVYIETPDLMQQLGSSEHYPLHGVFAHLEHDIKTGRPELRLLLDAQATEGPILVPVPVHLGKWTLQEALARTLEVCKTNGDGLGVQLPPGFAQMLHVNLEPIISLLLSLCSQAAEFSGPRPRPAYPEPKRVKGGARIFAPDKPTTWEVGVRLGSALRRAYAASEVGHASGHSGPRPHIRRAHWHSFWMGPVDGDRRLDVRWMPPIPVNLEDGEEFPATIRPVK